MPPMRLIAGSLGGGIGGIYQEMCFLRVCQGPERPSLAPLGRIILQLQQLPVPSLARLSGTGQRRFHNPCRSSDSDIRGGEDGRGRQHVNLDADDNEPCILCPFLVSSTLSRNPCSSVDSFLIMAAAARRLSRFSPACFSTSNLYPRNRRRYERRIHRIANVMPVLANPALLYDSGSVDSVRD
jgi:hypothetical protein